LGAISAKPFTALGRLVATYGIPKEVPIPENHPQHPINSYGRSKLMMDADYPGLWQCLRYSVRYSTISQKHFRQSFGGAADKNEFMEQDGP